MPGVPTQNCGTAIGGVTHPSNQRGSIVMKRGSSMNGIAACTILAGMLIAGASLAAANAAPQGDPLRGKGLYQACAGCHSLDENDLGPRHRGVVGRRAGSLEDYSYSAALKAS